MCWLLRRVRDEDAAPAHVDTWPQSGQPPKGSDAQLIKAGTCSLSALRAAAPKRGGALDRQFPGASLSGMGGGGHTQHLGNVDTPALGAVRLIAGPANQCLENVSAGFALIFIKWHERNDPSIIEADGTRGHQGDRAATIRACLTDVFCWASQGLSMPGGSGQLVGVSTLQLEA